MELALFLLKNHFGTGLVAVVFLLLWWKDGARVLSFLEKLEKWYDRARRVAEEKKLYAMIETAYGHVNELSSRTETTVDDKAAEGMEWVLKAMKHAGLDPTDETEDVIKGHFNKLHDAERRAKELHGMLPLAVKPEGSES